MSGMLEFSGYVGLTCRKVLLYGARKEVHMLNSKDSLCFMRSGRNRPHYSTL